VNHVSNCHPCAEIRSEAEAVLAKGTKDILAPHIGKNSSLDLRAMNVASEPTIKIPASAARLFGSNPG
jgi:hypothetical protein